MKEGKNVNRLSESKLKSIITESIKESFNGDYDIFDGKPHTYTIDVCTESDGCFGWAFPNITSYEDLDYAVRQRFPDVLHWKNPRMNKTYMGESRTNKNVVRLTESQLRNMIAESVSSVLNEIGDTRFGQYMLGRTFARQQKYPRANVVNAREYTNSRHPGFKDFLNGEQHQLHLQSNIEKYNNATDQDDNKRDYIRGANWAKNDMDKNSHELAYNSLPSYKKKVDDEMIAKDNETRNQVRQQKYNLNNPIFNEPYNESKLNAKIGKIVNESINKILKK